MRSKDYIETPIHTETSKSYIDSYLDQPHSWEKRARKLQERRWKRIAGRLSRNDEYRHYKPRHQS